MDGVSGSFSTAFASGNSTLAVAAIKSDQQQTAALASVVGAALENVAQANEAAKAAPTGGRGQLYDVSA
jgi:hypothetical protein